MGSVQTTTGNYLKSPTTPIPTPTGNWFFCCWVKQATANYVAGDHVSMSLTQSPGGVGEGFTLDAGAFAATSLSAVLFSNGGASLAHNEFLTGSDTAWVHICIQHVSASANYTVRWRKENATVYNTFTLTTGALLLLAGTDLAFFVGNDIFNEFSIDSSACQFVCQQTTISDAQLLTISQNLSTTPSGTNLHYLILNTATNAQINGGTGGNWTVTGTLQTNPSQPTEMSESLFFGSGTTS